MKHAALAKRASTEAGGPTALARALGKSPSEISQWISGRRPVPAACAASLEKLTTVTRQDLFPDQYTQIWPELAQPSTEEKEVGGHD